MAAVWQWGQEHMGWRRFTATQWFNWNRMYCAFLHSEEPLEVEQFGELDIVFAYFGRFWNFYLIIWDRLSLDEVKMFWREYLETSIGILYNAPSTRESWRYLSGTAHHVYPKLLICHPKVVEELYIVFVKMTQTLQNATESRNSYLFKHQLAYFMEVLDNLNLDWIMHFSALKDMLPVIITMDCIKYRWMLPAYLAGMLYLMKSDPAVWRFFQEGNCSVQKNPIPFAAIGWDHAEKQENEKLKISGGLKEYLVTLIQRQDSF